MNRPEAPSVGLGHFHEVNSLQVAKPPSRLRASIALLSGMSTVYNAIGAVRQGEGDIISLPNAIVSILVQSLSTASVMGERGAKKPLSSVITGTLVGAEVAVAEYIGKHGAMPSYWSLIAAGAAGALATVFTKKRQQVREFGEVYDQEHDLREKYWAGVKERERENELKRKERARALREMFDEMLTNDPSFTLEGYINPPSSPRKRALTSRENIAYAHALRGYGKRLWEVQQAFPEYEFPDTLKPPQFSVRGEATKTGRRKPVR